MSPLADSFFKHSFKTKSRENLGLAVYNSGFQRCESGYLWGPAVRDHYLIHYIVSGKGTYTVGDSSFSLQAGDLFLTYEDQLVSYQADPQCPWEYYWVGFNGTEAVRLLRQTPFTRAHPTLTLEDGDGGALRDALLRIYESSGSTPASEVRMVGMLYLFLAALMELAHSAGRLSGMPGSYLESACTFIAHNYSHAIEVDDVARNVGISRSHLYRMFRKALCLSPSEYLVRFRINQACTLLRGGALSVKEIANSVGFDDPMYFSRVFKKLKGVAPSRYSGSMGD